MWPYGMIEILTPIFIIEYIVRVREGDRKTSSLEDTNLKFWPN